MFPASLVMSKVNANRKSLACKDADRCSSGEATESQNIFNHFSDGYKTCIKSLHSQYGKHDQQVLIKPNKVVFP